LQKGQCEREPHQTKTKIKNKSTLYLVRTKVSELAGCSGVKKFLKWIIMNDTHVASSIWRPLLVPWRSSNPSLKTLDFKFFGATVLDF